MKLGSSPGAPQFVERHGSICPLPPYTCNGTRLYGFFVEGDAATIQTRIIDPALNAPTAGATDYRAFSNHVLITFADITQGRSYVPPEHNLGWIPELSFTVWVPTVAVKRIMEIDVAQRLLFFVPYIVVDNGWSLKSGREVYGYPKDIGTFEFPGNDDPPNRFSAATDVLPKYGHDQQVRNEQVALFEKTASRNSGAEGSFQPWTSLEDAAHAIARLLTGKPTLIPGLRLGLDLVKLLLTQEVPGVFLKQFRSAKDGHLACYQAIIEAPAQATAVHGFGRLEGDYMFSTVDFDSHPIKADLGLPSTTVDAVLPFWLNFDFTQKNGEEVWRA